MPAVKDKNLSIEFSRRLKKAIKVKGCDEHSYEDLSRLFNKSVFTIHAWLYKGSLPSAANLIIISDVLGVSIDYLIKGEGEI